VLPMPRLELPRRSVSGPERRKDAASGNSQPEAALALIRAGE
jgi:hypothetical protein